MALKATIYKIDLTLADMDHHAYQQHSLTLARHPSETEERLMVRLAAFVLHAHRAADTAAPLLFGKGLSDDEEPDLWQKDLTGAIRLWLMVGLPQEREIRKACGRAEAVVVMLYGGRAADIWWQQNQKPLAKLPQLTVLHLPETQALAALARRNLNLNCTLQDGALHFNHDAGSFELAVERLQ